nr:unnamed protein product [Spirometra erinaceieuropaei]
MSVSESPVPCEDSHVSTDVNNIKEFSNDLKSMKNGSLELPTKVENFKAWSSTALKCTKQVIEEKLGTTTPTRDPEIEAKVGVLKQVQAQYKEILLTARQMSRQITALSELQKRFSFQLSSAGQQQPELENEFSFNAEAQRLVSLNSANLVSALDVFCGGLETFCNRTVPDTLATIRNLEQSRIVYDAYRGDMERLHIPQDPPTTSPGSAETVKDQRPPPQQQQQQHRQEQQQHQIRKKFEDSREKYCEVRAAVDVKINMLHENRTRVMKKQLQILHSATAAHFAGTASDLKDAFARLPSMKNAVARGGQPPVPPPSSFPDTTPPSPHPETPTSCSPRYFSVDPNAESKASGDVFQE